MEELHNLKAKINQLTDESFTQRLDTSRDDDDSKEEELSAEKKIFPGLESSLRLQEKGHRLPLMKEAQQQDVDGLEVQHSNLKDLSLPHDLSPAVPPSIDPPTSPVQSTALTMVFKGFMCSQFNLNSVTDIFFELPCFLYLFPLHGTSIGFTRSYNCGKIAIRFL